MHTDMVQCPECRISDEEAREILDVGEYCVLSMVDEDGAPYCIPLSYVVEGDELFIHTGSLAGKKIANWRRDGRVCLTVAVDVDPCFEDSLFTTRYASVVATGRIAPVEDGAGVRRVLAKLCLKYMPEFRHEIGGAIEREIATTTAWVVHLEHITGKAGRRIRNGKGCVGRPR